MDVAGAVYRSRMVRQRKYSDEQLVAAIAASTSWRGALRELGLSGASSGAIRSVRSHADQLGIDYGHFVGRRRWTEQSLRDTIARAGSWGEVVSALGYVPATAAVALKGHAVRLGIDTAHLQTAAPAAKCDEPNIARLSRAGSLLAAAWFVLCGYDVSWPLEPSRYDLLVTTSTRQIRRVQVKTTTVKDGNSWKVYLSTSRRQRSLYDPDEIDDFFVIDGDLAYYLIPVSVVGGLHAIHLSAYERFRLVGIE